MLVLDRDHRCAEARRQRHRAGGAAVLREDPSDPRFGVADAAQARGVERRGEEGEKDAGEDERGSPECRPAPAAVLVQARGPVQR